LAEVGPIFEEYVERNGVAGRLRFVSGSFFDQPLPSGAEAPADSQSYDAVPEGGALIVIDDDRSTNAFGLMMVSTC